MQLSPAATSCSLPDMPHPLPHPPSSQVLKTVGLTSPMGLDYSHVLRNHLLPVPEYCACSSAHAFQGEGAAGRGGAAASWACSRVRGLLGGAGQPPVGHVALRGPVT